MIAWLAMLILLPALGSGATEHASERLEKFHLPSQAAHMIWWRLNALDLGWGGEEQLGCMDLRADRRLPLSRWHHLRHRAPMLSQLLKPAPSRFEPCVKAGRAVAREAWLEVGTGIARFSFVLGASGRLTRRLQRPRLVS